MAFFQAVKIPLIADGAPVAVAQRKAPIVAGRDAIVRAMVNLPEGVEAATLTFTVEVGGARFATTEDLASSSSAADPDSGIVVAVPASALRAGVTYHVELSDESDGLLDRFPPAGEAPLQALETGPLAVRLMPFEVNGFVPDTSPAVVEGMRLALLAQYPVTAVSVTVAPVEDLGTIEGNPINEVFLRTGQVQEDDWVAGGDSKVYYFGMATGVATRDEFEGITGTSEAGIGEQYRAYWGAGAAFGDQRAEDTLTHELGHAHQLLHAPCDASQVDEDFPQDDGSIGVEGYDQRTGAFIAESTKDMMSNCRPRWISDYHYALLADHVIATQDFPPF